MRSISWAVKAAALSKLLHIAAAQPSTNSTPNAVSFSTTYLFTANVLLGASPPGFDTNPITIPGGIIVPESIVGGTVSGPYLNANITSGLAAPRVYRKGTLQEPVIDLYGVTDDGAPLTLHETGIGSPSGQMTRLELQIGGRDQYDVLTAGFVLATVNPNAQRTEVTVMAYLVENTAGASE